MAARSQIGGVDVVAVPPGLNYDWLLRGEPFGAWLAARSDRPVVGPPFELPNTTLVASWAGLIFDLTIVGRLPREAVPSLGLRAVVPLPPRRRPALFQIGLFPLGRCALTPVFFSPAWPERTMALIR
ncbi:MAG: HTTM domain-containing protein [Candidatus Microthrix sp.]|nr:HTTM domain-containing protein [Candidatus Microthrix sp.]